MKTVVKRFCLWSIGLVGASCWAVPNFDIRIIPHSAGSDGGNGTQAEELGGLSLELGWPEGYSEPIDIYTTTNLCGGGAWQIVEGDISISGLNTYTWTDPTAGEHPTAFYSVGQTDLDEDGDALNDSWEVLYGLNPDSYSASYDDDEDRLTSAMEFAVGGNPKGISDANGNDIPDEWEAYYQMVGSAEDDPDGDGASNASEYFHGTDPNVSMEHQFGIYRYVDEAYENGETCVSVEDEKAAYEGDLCLNMWIEDNYHYTTTFRFGSENTIENKAGYYIRFNIRADRVLAADYPLLLELAWSDERAVFEVPDYLYTDDTCSERWTGGLGEEYVTCFIPIPETFRRFRDFKLMYDTSVSEVQEARFSVDDIIVMNGVGLSVEAAEVLDDRHVMITYDQLFNHYSARDTASHVLRDSHGTVLEIDRVGLRSWVTAFDGEIPTVRHYAYLELGEGSEVVSGETYSYSTSVKNSWLREPVQTELSFSFNDKEDISSSIKVNQVGYLPQALKYCYVGNYLGDGGEMPIHHDTAYLCNDAGNVVTSVALVERSEDDLFEVTADELKPFCGEQVFVADFSAVTAPGTYYVWIPGMGRSYDFEIKDSVYNETFYHTARAFYYQRSGTALEAEYAGPWSRPASHTTPSIYHNSIEELSGELYSPSLEPAIGEEIDLTGGWYDAADYNKYVKSASEAVNCMLSIYELAPEKFVCDSLNIPESGNGIPDVMDQAKWEIDWLAKMVSANGAVFNKCSFDHFAYVMPQERNEEKMYATTKTTRDTAYACAALAKAARIFEANGWYPAEAALYREKAILAWECLQAHPETYPLPQSGESLNDYQNPAGDGYDQYGEALPDINTGPYYQEPDDLNVRVWAALEMMQLVGGAEIEAAFEASVDGFSDDPFLEDLENMIVKDWWHGASNPMRLYPLMKMGGEQSAAVEAGLRRLLSVYQAGYDQWRYKISMKNTLTSVNFGGYSMSTRWAVYYILFYELLGEDDLLTMAMQNLDVQLGANPLSTTYITGIGDFYPKHPHCKISEYDGIEEAIPGFSVYGCAHSLPNKGSYTLIMENAYPYYQGSDPAFDYYPSARKFVDAWAPVKMGEFVIDNMARTAMCFGYFSDPNADYAPQE